MCFGDVFRITEAEQITVRGVKTKDKERTLLCETNTMEVANNNQRVYYQYWLRMLEERGN